MDQQLFIREARGLAYHIMMPPRGEINFKHVYHQTKKLTKFIQRYRSPDESTRNSTKTMTQDNNNTHDNDPWLAALTRCMQAELSLQRCHRELHDGSGVTGAVVNDYANEDLDRLAAGEQITDHSGTRGIATIATNGDLPLAQWDYLRDQCWKNFTNLVSTDSNNAAAKRYAMVRESLSALETQILDLLFVSRVTSWLRPTLKRCFLVHVHQDLEFNPALVMNLLQADKSSDSIISQQHLFGKNGTLQSSGYITGESYGFDDALAARKHRLI